MSALNISSHYYFHIYLAREDTANAKEISLEILTDFHVFSFWNLYGWMYVMYVCAPC